MQAAEHAREGAYLCCWMPAHTCTPTLLGSCATQRSWVIAMLLELSVVSVPHVVLQLRAVAPPQPDLGLTYVRRPITLTACPTTS